MISRDVRHARRTTCVFALLFVTACSGMPGTSVSSTTSSSAISRAVAVKSVEATSIAATVSSYAATVAANGALAYYHLDDSGSQIIDSISGNAAGEYGPSVRVGGTPLTSAETASAIFPGGTSSIATDAVITNPAALQKAVTGVTVEAWYEQTAVNGSGIVQIAGYGTDPSGPYGIHICGSTIEFDVHPQNGGMTVWGPVLQVNTPYYIAGTYNGSTASLYVNGQLVSSKKTQGYFKYPTGTFSIGGTVGSTSAAFDGKIGDVAVYGQALTAAQVESHFQTGAYHPLSSETPTSAAAFINSIGVNTHFSQIPYNGPLEGTIVNYLVASGIRHIRDRLVENGNYQAVLAGLAAHGIHSTLTTAVGNTIQQIHGYPSTIGGSFEAYEGLNEPYFLGTAWPQTTTTFTEDLWAGMQVDTALAQYPVIGPEVGPYGATLGNMSAYMNYGNMHDYFAEYNPETGGWGSSTPQGVYGSLTYNVNMAALVSGTEPIIATETGYGSTPTGSATNIDNATAARYIARTYFHQYNAGVARTFVYEFVDEGTNNAEFTNYGFLNANMQPKPTYVTMTSIIADLADSGTATTLTPLT